MATTTNFGWETPDDTDLVKDGAAAIRTLGNSIDTSMVDLKGGTTGQVLSKNSNTDMDFTWVAQDDSNAIQNAIVDAKGDLITATAADTPARLAVGTNGHVLTADSTTGTGIKWAAPSAGLTLIQRSSFTDVANTSTTFDSIFTSTYKAYQVVIEKLHAPSGATADQIAQMQMYYSGTLQTTNYYGGNVFATSSPTGINVSNGSEIRLASQIGYDVLPNSYVLFFNCVGNTSEKFNMYGMCYQGNSGVGNFMSYANQTNRTYTGFQLKAASGNITGTVAIYGIASA